MERSWPQRMPYANLCSACALLGALSSVARASRATGYGDMAVGHHEQQLLHAQVQHRSPVLKAMFPVRAQSSTRASHRGRRRAARLQSFCSMLPASSDCL